MVADSIRKAPVSPERMAGAVVCWGCGDDARQAASNGTLSGSRAGQRVCGGIGWIRRCQWPWRCRFASGGLGGQAASTALSAAAGQSGACTRICRFGGVSAGGGRFAWRGRCRMWVELSGWVFSQERKIGCLVQKEFALSFWVRYILRQTHPRSF